jgi:hypothetical protein
MAIKPAGQDRAPDLQSCLMVSAQAVGGERIVDVVSEVTEIASRTAVSGDCG